MELSAMLGTLEIRPQRQVRRSPALIMFWGAFCALSILGPHGQMRLVHLVVGLISALVTVTLGLIWQRRARLTLDGDVLTYVGLWRRKAFAVSPTSNRVVIATVIGRWNPYDWQRWLLLDATGRARLTLDLTGWSPDALRVLCDRVGIPANVDTEPRRPAALRRAYPGAASWVLAYPYRFSFLLIGLLTVGVIAAQTHY